MGDQIICVFLGERFQAQHYTSSKMRGVQHFERLVNVEYQNGIV